MKMMRARDQMYSEENKKKIVMWNKNMIVGRWYVRDGGSGMIDHIEMAMPQWIGAPFLDLVHEYNMVEWIAILELHCDLGWFG